MSEGPARPSRGFSLRAPKAGTQPALPPSAASKFAAGVIVTAGAVICLVVESFLVPLRIAGVIAPVALVLEVIFHPLLTYLMWKATTSRIAVLIPVAIWAVLVYFLGNLTPEGDAIIAGAAWMPFGFLVVGGAAFLVSVAVLLQRPPRRPTP